MQSEIVCRRATMAEYSAAFASEGLTIIPGSSGSWWVGNEGRSIFREPVFHLEPPLPREVRKALWKACAPVATYTLPPDDKHPKNAWLYICRDNTYTLEKLNSAVRRNIRRALQTFRFEFVSADVFLKKGVTPFCDTRQRIGLSDGTPELFRDSFEPETRNPSHNVLGAWKDDTLAAFMPMSVVDDWVNVVAYASTEYLQLRPNNGLIHFALDYFLVQRKFKVVSFGLSSIQEGGKVDSLHRFKIDVGFEALPVHRAFVFHPLLAPFANRITLWGLRACTRIQPSSRALRKATGLLATYLGQHHMDCGPLNEDKNKDMEGA
jgi:hypothetical protein